MKRTITVAASTPFLLGACGLLFTKGPPAGHEKMMTPFSCTESWTAPGLDILVGVLNIVFVTARPGADTQASYSETIEQAYQSVIGTLIFGGSAGIGIDRITKCSAAKRALTLRQAEAAAALAARRRSADLIGVRKVQITGGEDTITVGTWTQLVAQAYDSTDAVILDRSIAWSSSNDTIASVSADGLVRARRVGAAVITATAGTVVGTASLVVRTPP